MPIPPLYPIQITSIQTLQHEPLSYHKLTLHLFSVAIQLTFLFLNTSNNHKCSFYIFTITIRKFKKILFCSVNTTRVLLGRLSFLDWVGSFSRSKSAYKETTRLFPGVHSLSHLGSLLLPSRHLLSLWFLPPQSDTSMECVSIHQSCLTLATPPTGNQPGKRHRGSQLSFPPPTQPPTHPSTPVTDKHIRQGAGLVDEKKFTNCLIIQISMIMNHYSMVREHGVQPELPPQHSSCES